MSTLQARVEEAVAAGYSLAELARAAGVDSAAVSHWHKGRTKSLKAESALRLAEFTGRSAAWWAQGKTAGAGAWRNQQHAPEGVSVRPVAQELIQPEPDDEPSLHPWGFIVSVPASDLPKRFRAAMPDDALAPDTPRGLVLYFSTEAEPVIGHGVLVQDAAGGRHVRRYAQGLGGAWRAEARNTAYMTLHSGDGVQLLAVVTGRDSGAV